ncbi:hypothetical protein TIFTF001_016541 [Ficus carica]|uniref:Uncharacterized protein n=1 Tax=Ficus carica TaxID=3494 RepID=A0AA88A3B7_FICCA|nr:hypothetical protein TIFTF001_016541 [Ficus carica]
MAYATGYTRINWDTTQREGGGLRNCRLPPLLSFAPLSSPSELSPSPVSSTRDVEEETDLQSSPHLPFPPQEMWKKKRGRRSRPLELSPPPVSSTRNIEEEADGDGKKEAPSSNCRGHAGPGKRQGWDGYNQLRFVMDNHSIGCNRIPWSPLRRDLELYLENGGAMCGLKEICRHWWTFLCKEESLNVRKFRGTTGAAHWRGGECFPLPTPLIFRNKILSHLRTLSLICGEYCHPKESGGGTNLVPYLVERKRRDGGGVE